jgi:predicted metal-dependent phosphoesterase TrpH
MLKEYRADLHIHTILSPCTELTEMSPRAIIERARHTELDIIAICDHNSCENVAAARKVSPNGDLVVLGGIEIVSREEVHTLGLFDDEDETLRVQEVVYDNLPGENDEESFGYQVVANEKDEVVGFNKRLLIGATTLSLEEIVDLIHAFNGLAIASHIDREANSVIGQLGFIPEGLALDALELSPKVGIEEARKKFPQISNYPLISSSDAHSLCDIGKSSTTFLMKVASIVEMKMALTGREGRKVVSVHNSAEL